MRRRCGKPETDLAALKSIRVLSPPTLTPAAAFDQFQLAVWFSEAPFQGVLPHLALASVDRPLPASDGRLHSTAIRPIGPRGGVPPVPTNGPRATDAVAGRAGRQLIARWSRRSSVPGTG